MIDLKHLSLDGWMSYDTAEIDLSAEGITRIQGAIGSGKSAVLEAIFYLLFGKTLRGKDSVNSLINKILQGGYDISLQLEIDGVAYTVQEIRDRPKKGLYFTSNGTDLRGKTDPDTRKKIIELLGISHSDFAAMAFLGQNQSQQLLSGTPGERARTLTDVFGLQRYDNAIAECKKDYDESLVDLASLEEKLKQYEEEFISLEDSLASDYEDINEDDYIELSDAIEEKISDIELKLTKINKLADKVKAHIYKFEAEEQQRNTAKKVKSEIRKIEKELRGLPDPKDRRTLEKNLSRLQGKITVINNKIDEANRAIKDAEKLTNICPVISEKCPVDVPKKHSALIIENCKSDKTKLQEEASVHAKNIQQCSSDLHDSRYYESLKDKLESKKEHLVDLDIPDANIDVGDSQQKLEKYNRSISKGKTKLRSLLDEKSEIQSKLAVSKSQRELVSKLEKAINDKEQAIQILTAQVKRKRKESTYLYAALLVFNKIKMYKIDLVLELLNKHIDEILDNISNGEYKAEFLSQKTSVSTKKTLDKINIIVYDSNKALPVELCSGGQKTEVGLAILLATWKTANSISNKGVTSLWLDEVFGPLHEDIINNVFNSVVDVVSELGTTSIKIITHRDLDERLFDHFWYISIKDGITTIETEGITNEGI